MDKLIILVWRGNLKKFYVIYLILIKGKNIVVFVCKRWKEDKDILGCILGIVFIICFGVKVMNIVFKINCLVVLWV